ncbi:hypothetical protein [Acinetobacter colistiniresistens]|uniref:hypothetical protein n=1 Tax=Acinetobacter colistiniresistens TaxID=280145 RepID=UPI00124F970F|nr:hypothetical protein [Acinetobacter colistiniresistens]
MFNQDLKGQLLNYGTADRELYFGVWKIDPRDERLLQFAAKYHEECESYDRSVCSGTCQYTRTAAPVGPHERQLIDSNAIAVRERIYTEAMKEGFSKQQVRTAISAYRF